MFQHPRNQRRRVQDKWTMRVASNKRLLESVDWWWDYWSRNYKAEVGDEKEKAVEAGNISWSLPLKVGSKRKV